MERAALRARKMVSHETSLSIFFSRYVHFGTSYPKHIVSMPVCEQRRRAEGARVSAKARVVELPASATQEGT